jgi:hypothetical protein
MSSLATILVNRLVLNLRERAVTQLPTTVETAGRFRAALPAGLTTDAVNNTHSITSTRNPPLTETVTMTREAVASMPTGIS